MRDRSRPSQVGELLRCLNIDPAALPAGAMPGAERDAWDGIFHAGGPRLPEAAAAAEVAAGGRLAAAARPGGMCAPTQQRAGGAGDLACVACRTSRQIVAAPQKPEAGAGCVRCVRHVSVAMSTLEHGRPWCAYVHTCYYGRRLGAALAASRRQGVAELRQGSRRCVRDASEGLGADGDAGRRWAEDFGGLSLDGVPPAAGAAWAGEFQRGAPGAPAGWADSFAAQQRGAFAGPGAGPQRGWAEQFAEEQRGAGWAEDFGRAEAAAVRLPLPLPYPYPDPNLPCRRRCCRAPLRDVTSV